MRRTILQEASAIFTLFALALAAAVGRPGVMLALGLVLLAAGVLGFWRTAAQGWLLTPALGGLTAVGAALAWFAQ